MRTPALSLGAKLNLALLAFLLLLGVATLAIIVYGFNRTQDNANARSRQALEEEGKLALMALIGGVSDSGAVQIDWAAEVGQRAGRYLEVVKAADTAGPYDVSGLVRTDEGVWYDPNPDRATDVVVPNHVAVVGGGLADDLAYSAPLDALLPALTGTFPGQIAGEAFKPNAIGFIGMNGVGRYYPPIGIHETIPAEVDISEFYDRLGPVGNPERKTLWTPPYEDLAGQGLVITAQSPVYEGDAFRGVIEVDLSIASLVQQVNALKPTASGFTFYLDKEGELLRTDSFDLLSREAAENEEFAAILEAMRNAPDGRVVVERIALDGNEVFIAHRAMVPLGGSIGSVAPVDEVTAQAALITASIDDEANRTLLVMLIAMVALFVVGLVGATWLNRRVLIAPIQQLVVATEAVASGDLNTTVTIDRSDELGTLASSFNSMTADLRTRRDALESEMRQRESTQEELRALLAAMTDVVMVFDREGRCLRIAPTNPDLLYVPAEDAVGRTLHDLLPAAEANAFVTAIRAALDEGEAKSIEYPMRIGDKDLWFLATISPMSTDTVVYVARDITERVNARQELERQVAERTRELDTLLRADAELFRSLDLDEVLKALVDIAIDVMGAEKCLVTIWDRERGSVSVRASRNVAPESVALFSAILPRPGSALPDQVVGNLNETMEIETYPEGLREFVARENVKASIDVPMHDAAGRVLGGYGVAYTREHHFDERERKMLEALAERAAVAIENAALYERAQQAASLEERQRLARELHDSVSQALYGIALGARTARTLLDQDAQKAAEPLDYVLSLAEAGLTEMRALIFELRPESLAAEGVVVALEKQIASARARHGLDITFQSSPEPDVPFDVKETVYRIGQEAIHNTVKHAKASHVDVVLTSSAGGLELKIVDDGVGFHPDADFAGHLGLQSMRERAAKSGGSLLIESTPGHGATIRLILPVRLG